MTAGRGRAVLIALLVILGAVRPVPLLAAPAASARPDSLTDLPLVEVAATRVGGRRMVVLITGDGDWAATVKGIARTLADSGMPVVALKARAYLSRRPTPDALARDVERIVRYYAAAWQREEVVLVGFSRGADFLPFVANRLPEDLRARTPLLAMLSPGRQASFEFHLVDLIRDVSRPSDVPTLPEAARSAGVPMLCVYGHDEAEHSLCTEAPSGMMRVVERGGGHRTTDHALLSSAILESLAGRGR